MASDKAQREKQQLKQVMQTANLHKDIQKYVLETPWAESVADFFDLVKATDYEEELVTLVNANVESQKTSPLQKSRIRAAWRAAKPR